MKSISVIVRTKNSGTTLASCLTGLLSQTIAPQIIVVDSGSSDNTFEIASSFPVKWVALPKDKPFNYSYAINTGIAASDGEYIMVVSSHVIIKSEHVLEKMLGYLVDAPETVAVSAKKLKQREEKEQITIVNKHNFFGKAMYNYCSMFRRADWQARSFNEEIPTAEDQEWAWYFLQQDRETVVISGLPVEYLNPYYNFNKDVREYVTMGRYVNPAWISKPFLVKRFFRNFRQLLKANWNIFFHDQRFLMAIMFFVFFNKGVEGTYNKKLE